MPQRRRGKIRGCRIDNIPIGLYPYHVRPVRGRSHETHEAGTDAAPARCGLVSRSSRGPRGSALRALTTRARGARWTLPPVCGRSCIRERRKTQARPGVRRRRDWSAAGRAPFRQRVPALRQARIRLDAPRGAPSPLSARGKRKDGRTRRPDKEYGRRSVGWSRLAKRMQGCLTIGEMVTPTRPCGSRHGTRQRMTRSSTGASFAVIGASHCVAPKADTRLSAHKCLAGGHQPASIVRPIRGRNAA